MSRKQLYKSIDIVILGYFGKHNFGDDILMCVAYGLAKSIKKDARIGIRLSGEDRYIAKMLIGDITFIPFGTRNKHALVIHGGGGTFFDFDSYRFFERINNYMLFFGGIKSYLFIDSILRRCLRKQRLSGEKRIGIGLGIGTFSKGSRKLREALPILSDFDALWVRDRSSVDNLSYLGVTPPTVLGSDLAFLHEYWCPPHLFMCKMNTQRNRPKIGLILRDWPSQDGEQLSSVFRPALDRLRADYDITVVSLDENTDQVTLKSLGDYPQKIWQPEQEDIGIFCERLVDFDVFLTARAHGAICGACLGRPSVILAIEPKLETVHDMLKQSSVLVVKPFKEERLSEALQQALSISMAAIRQDVMTNRRDSLTAFQKTREMASI